MEWRSHSQGTPEAFPPTAQQRTANRQPSTVNRQPSTVNRQPPNGLPGNGFWILAGDWRLATGDHL